MRDSLEENASAVISTFLPGHDGLYQENLQYFRVVFKLSFYLAPFSHSAKSYNDYVWLRINKQLGEKKSQQNLPVFFAKTALIYQNQEEFRLKSVHFPFVFHRTKISFSIFL